MRSGNPGGYHPFNSSNGQPANQKIGPSAHWNTLRRHGESEVLASKARDYILRMLRQDGPGNNSR